MQYAKRGIFRTSYIRKRNGGSYFHAEYVDRVETISDYQEGALVNKGAFIRVEKLYLTEKGREHIDDFIAELNAREDILCAERDYEYPMGLA